MPAAVVIPAPIAYIKVVAVKKARSWISGCLHVVSWELGIDRPRCTAVGLGLGLG